MLKPNTKVRGRGYEARSTPILNGLPKRSPISGSNPLYLVSTKTLSIEP